MKIRMNGIKTVLVWGCLLLGGVVLSGCSESEITEGVKTIALDRQFAPDQVAQAVVQRVTENYEAVGTIRPRTETSIEAQVNAQVRKVHVNPGDKVEKESLLISLDDRRFKARLDQSQQGLEAAISRKHQADQAVVAAHAAFSKAETDYKRVKSYLASQAATSQDFENAESMYLQAKAGLTQAKAALAASESGIKQAEEVVREAKIALGFTTITAPNQGEVLKRLVEPGDLALPGKPLLVLQTSGFLRLEAYVREGLIGKVKIGEKKDVVIDTLEKKVTAVVEEIVPYADPKSRTFMVKSELPPVEGLYPGMYGKLLIPVTTHEVIVVPEKAIRHMGQLSMIYVKTDDIWTSRYVKLGKRYGATVEILSGIADNEIIGWKE